MKQKFVAISGEAITWRQSQFKCSVMCTLFFCNAAWKLPRITSLYSFAHRYYMLKKREVTACAITYIVFNHHHVGLGYTMKTSRQDSFERHFLWGALPKEKNYLTKLSRGSFSNEKQFCWFFWVRSLEMYGSMNKFMIAIFVHFLGEYMFHWTFNALLRD